MKASLILVYTLTAFTVSFLLVPVLIKLLSQWRVFDSPGRHKIHESYKPSMGGIPIFIGVTFSLGVALSYSELSQLKYFFIALTLMFITGLRDDFLTLSPREKMLSQILPIFLLVIFGDAVLSSLYEIWPAYEFPHYISWPLTMFTILVLTNSYNLIDGVDGLAGTIGSLCLIFFGFWFLFTSNIVLALISFSFCGAIAGFLVFNWQPSKIFMGDTGALTIGFLLAVLIIKFVNTNFRLSEDHIYHFKASISTAVSILIIPIFDTARVIILRLRKFESPFKADKNHLHHQFLKLGFSHAQTVAALGGINIFFIGLAWVLRNERDTLILPIVVAICLLINLGLRVATRKIHERKS